MLKFNRLDGTVKFKVQLGLLSRATTMAVCETSERFNFADNVMTSAIVYESQPTKLVFFNDNTGKVVKVFDVKQEILALLVCSSFRFTGQILLVTNDYSELTDSHRLAYRILNVSQTKKSVRTVGPIALVGADSFLIKDDTEEDKRFIELSAITALALNPELVGELSGNFDEFIKVLKGLDKIKCLGYSCCSSYWTEDFNQGFVNNRVEAGKTARFIFEQPAPNGSLLVFAEGYLNFRRSRRNSSFHVLSENISQPSKHYFMTKSEVVVKRFSKDLALMLKPNLREESARQQYNNHVAGARIFLPWKQTSDNRYTSPVRSMVSFSLAGMVDFCVSNSKLYVNVDYKQIYVYDNFQALFDETHNNVQWAPARYLSDKNVIKAAEAIDSKPHQNLKTFNSTLEVISRAFNRAKGSFCGFIEDFQNFELPQPDRILELSLPNERFKSVEAFSEGGADTVIMTTKIDDTSPYIEKSCEHSRCLVLRRNDVLFDSVFDEIIANVNHRKTDNHQGEGRSSVMEEVLEIITESGSVITHRFFPGSRTNPLSNRDMQAERSRAASGRTNQSTRVLTF